MKVLIIGSGGREHALAWKLSQECEVFCAPGNPGMEEIGECFELNLADRPRVMEICQQVEPDLIVIGPEDPLISGLADVLRGEGYSVFGPNQGSARIEGSKSLAKDLMKRAEVPTAEFQSFSHAGLAKEYCASRFVLGQQVAVKASGAALGKGVHLCTTLEEAENSINRMLVEMEFGEAGRTIVVEDMLHGFEFSLLTLVSGTKIKSLPVAQDYKRIGDGDSGLNTGGMGSYSPVKQVTPEMIALTEEQVVMPILQSLSEIGEEYRGVLFSGLMVQDGRVYCLEYNVRFGDPEIQSVVRRLGKGFAGALKAVADGADIPDFEVSEDASVTVVLASEGYPENYEKGKEITIGSLLDGVEIFHAGTKKDGDRLLTNGGRVLGVSAVDSTVEKARALAYQGVEQVSFEGKTFRTDIAQ